MAGGNSTMQGAAVFSAIRLHDGIRFTFVDISGNSVSVVLSYEQVDAYRDGLDMFSDNPLKEKS